MSTTEQKPTPTSRGSRPPFNSETGRALATRHGVYSSAAIAERAEDVHGRLLELFPELDSPRLIGSVKRYVDAVAKEQLATEALLQQHEEGKMSPRLLEAANSATRLAQELADQLGLSVEGHARIRQAAVTTLEHEERVVQAVFGCLSDIFSDLQIDYADPKVRAIVRPRLLELDANMDLGGDDDDDDDAGEIVDAEIVPEKRGLLRKKK
jgi:hypothetical protein